MIGFLEQCARDCRFHYGLQRIDQVDFAQECAPEASILSERERQSYPSGAVAKRQREWLAGRMAAKRALASWLGVKDWRAQAQRYSVLNDAAGAPFIAERPLLRLSVSHSHAYAVAVIASQHIGVDLERIEPRPAALTRYFCSGAEQRHLQAHNSWAQGWDADLTELWCRKEAVAKYTRLGGQLPFARIDVLADSVTLPAVCPDVIRLVSTVEDGYAIAIAVAMDEQVAAEQAV